MIFLATPFALLQFFGMLFVPESPRYAIFFLPQQPKCMPSRQEWWWGEESGNKWLAQRMLHSLRRAMAAEQQQLGSRYWCGGGADPARPDFGFLPTAAQLLLQPRPHGRGHAVPHAYPRGRQGRQGALEASLLMITPTRLGGGFRLFRGCARRPRAALRPDCW